MPKPSQSKPGSARRVCLKLLRQWREGGGYAADLLAAAMAHDAMDGRDRALVQAMLYGVLRNLRLLDHWITGLRQGGRLGEDERDLLRLGLCQVLILRLPDHAAVDTTVACAGRARGLVNAVLRRAIRERDALLESAGNLPAAVRCSHPDWLAHRWEQQWGAEAAAALMTWNQQPAPVWLRLNRLRTETWERAEDICGEALTPAACPEADLSMLGDLAGDFRSVDRLPKHALDQGLVYAQDPATAAACRLLDPRPGETVLDGCAAPGGKTALLWQMMAGEGRLLACDLPGARLDRLRANLDRLGAGGVDLLGINWLDADREPPPGQIDRILLDLPCSNTGVMRRRIDVRWRLQPDEFAGQAAVQRRIVRRVLPLLKPGGVLVYSTCSLEREENEDNVARLLEEHPGLRLEATHVTRPWEHGIDGGFAARLITP